MKKIETIAQGANFSAVNVGKISEIIEHELPMGPDFTIQGKVFAGRYLSPPGTQNCDPAQRPVAIASAATITSSGT